VKTTHCPSPTAHGRHEWDSTRSLWRWKHALRRDCHGHTFVECDSELWHGPHWTNERRDELCRGLGLAGICQHGEQMLNECGDCEAAR
jgi:hypothetical protein